MTRRRIAALMVVVATVAALAVTATASPSSAEPLIVRLGGADRYDTAALISRTRFESDVPVALIATGTAFPDALAGAPAAVKLGGPVLLAEQGRLPEPTARELERLQPQRIIVLGGDAAIGPSVVAALSAFTTGSVDRVAGPDRASTAAAISQLAFPDAETVLIATGANFPDALSAGAVAAADIAANDANVPLLLVNQASVPTATLDELRRLSPSTILVFGGESAISSAVVQELSTATGATARRIAGADRYDTSARAAEAFSPPSDVYLATGVNFPDALAGTVVAGLDGAPILLVPGDCVTSSVLAALTALDPANVTILGGPAVIADAVGDLTPCTPATLAPTDCSPAYPDFCIPPPPPVLQCEDLQTVPGAFADFTVLPPDPHSFDPDGNGRGCDITGI